MNKDLMQHLSAYLRVTDGKFVDREEGEITFDMSTYCSTWGHGCGAAACIAGTAVLMFSPLAVYQRIMNMLSYERATAIQKRAGALLDLADDEADKLFVPTYLWLNSREVLQSRYEWDQRSARDEIEDELTDPPPRVYYMSDVTPEWAANCIDKFVETGEIDWLNTRPASV